MPEMSHPAPTGPETVQTFWDLLAWNAEVHPERTAIVMGDEVLSFGALAAQANGIAAWLEGQGIGRGDRVGVHLAKSPFEVAAIFAAARLGAVFVNINAGLSARQVHHIATDCGLAALIGDAPRLRRLEGREGDDAEDIFSVVPHILQLGRGPARAGAVLFDDADRQAAPEGPCPALDVDLAALVYTSGSTGAPKGVMLTNANIVGGARSVARYLRNTKDDRVLSVTPFSFDYGLNQLTTMMLTGGQCVLQPSPMAAEILRSLEASGANGLGLVPTLWVDLMEYLEAADRDVTGLRWVTNTGGRIPEATLALMRRRLIGTDIVLMYGLTESFRSTYLPPHLFDAKQGAIGIAIPGAEVFVVDGDRICGAGEPGELVHRGALVSRGYWNRPDLTAEKIRPCPALRPLIGEEPVVFSGDLVRRDEDGILWFVSRLDQMIKTSGYRVSPGEVEAAIAPYPDIAEVFAFGVPDDRLGEAISVVLRAHDARAFDADAFRAWCRREMAGYLVPTHLHLRETEFPRNSNGKIDGGALKAAITAQDDTERTTP